MTLLQQAQALSSVLSAAVDQDKMRLDIGRMADRAKAVHGAAETLEKVAVAAGELAPTGSSALPPETRSGLESLREGLEAAQEDLASDPLAGARDDFQKLAQRVSDEARRVSASTSEAWRRYRETLSIPNVDEDFIATLERAGVDVADTSLQVQSALSRLAIREARTLPLQGDVATLQTVVADLAGALETLGSLVPPAAREFIVSASRETGASLDLLTDDVRRFLEDTGLTERYRIRQGRR